MRRVKLIRTAEKKKLKNRRRARRTRGKVRESTDGACSIVMLYAVTTTYFYRISSVSPARRIIHFGARETADKDRNRVCTKHVTDPMQI